MSVEFSPQLAREVVAIHVKDADWRKVRELLTQATDCEWRQEGEKWVAFWTPEAVSRHQSQSQANLAKSILNFASRRPGLAWEQQFLREQSAVLAGMRLNQRLVWASPPTSSQKAVTPGVAGALQDAIRRNPRGANARLIFSVTRDRDRYEVRVDGYEQNASPFSIGNSISLPTPSRPMLQPREPAGLQLSSKAASMRSWLTAKWAVSSFVQELAEDLKRPDVNEPLALWPGEALVKLAEGSNANLAAWIPDSAFQDSCYRIPANPFRLINIASWLAFGNSMSAKLESGSLVVRPLDPVDAKEGRVDRRAVAQFLSSQAAWTYPRLQGIADLAASCSPTAFQSPLMMASVNTWPEAMDVFRGQLDYDALMIWRNWRASGGPAGNQAPNAFGPIALNRFMYDGQRQLQLQVKAPEELKLLSSIEVSARIRRTIQVERTDYLPSGLGSQAVAHMQSSGSGGAMAYRQLGQPGVTMSPEQLASEQVERDIGGSTSIGSDPFRYFLPVETTYYNFMLRPSPESLLSAALVDVAAPRGVKPVPLHQMPEAFRSQYDRAYQALYQQRRQSGARSTGTRVVPPKP